MLSLLPAILLFFLFVFLFFREIRLEQARYREADRLGDEHIMREIEKFLREKRQYQKQEL